MHNLLSQFLVYSVIKFKVLFSEYVFCLSTPLPRAKCVCVTFYIHVKSHQNTVANKIKGCKGSPDPIKKCWCTSNSYQWLWFEWNSFRYLKLISIALIWMILSHYYFLLNQKLKAVSCDVSASNIATRNENKRKKALIVDQRPKKNFSNGR